MYSFEGSDQQHIPIYPPVGSPAIRTAFQGWQKIWLFLPVMTGSPLLQEAFLFAVWLCCTHDFSGLAGYQFCKRLAWCSPFKIICYIIPHSYTENNVQNHQNHTLNFVQYYTGICVEIIDNTQIIVYNNAIVKRTKHERENTKMKKFEIGTSYSMRSICDHNCIWTYTVTARTAQTITLSDGKETIKCRINKQISEWNKAETVHPLGRYSMAPSLTADKIA